MTINVNYHRCRLFARGGAMSLNTLAREVVERRTTPQARATASASAGSGQDALTSLTKYLPTETITLYIAGVAYIKADAPGWYWWFWGFLLVLTPAIVYLMTFIKLREVDASAHVSMTTCDMGFRMAASAI